MADRTFTVEMPLNGFPVSVCFNQFSIQQDGAWSILSVGYLSRGRLLDEVFSYALSQELINATRDDTINYLGRLGEILPMEQSVVPPAPKIIPVNVMVMAYRGDIGEVILSDFPFRRIVIDSPESKFEANPVALLRSPLNVHRHLIRVLYAPLALGN